MCVWTSSLERGESGCVREREWIDKSPEESRAADVAIEPLRAGLYWSY